MKLWLQLERCNILNKIIDKNLERIIKIKLCSEDIKSIDEIEDISIQNINLMQRKLNIDLTEISKIKRLKLSDCNVISVPNLSAFDCLEELYLNNNHII